ncbi:hypothetical protein NXV38_21745 [Bacteroides caccae]|nr:hypothetical protein [Bacteroides caccae]
MSQQVEELQAEENSVCWMRVPKKLSLDREARLMKTRNGFLQGYNVQSVVDSPTSLIGAMQVTDHPNDLKTFNLRFMPCRKTFRVEVAQASCSTPVMPRRTNPGP